MTRHEEWVIRLHPNCFEQSDISRNVALLSAKPLGPMTG